MPFGVELLQLQILREESAILTAKSPVPFGVELLQLIAIKGENSGFSVVTSAFRRGASSAGVPRSTAGLKP